MTLRARIAEFGHQGWPADSDSDAAGLPAQKETWGAVAILEATTMQSTECGEPLVSILERTLEVCVGCNFSRRFRAGLQATSPFAGARPIGMTRVGEIAAKVRDQDELPKAT
jgi:hypothetical protein